MASLNLLRYLVIKDCESDNQVSTNWFENDWLAKGLELDSCEHSYPWFKAIFFAFFFAMVSSPEVMFLLTTLGDIWYGFFIFMKFDCTHT